MKRNKNYFRNTGLKVFLLAGILTGASGNLMAQVLPPAQVPIDGGLTAVLAACGVYGAVKLYRKRKDQY